MTNELTVEQALKELREMFPDWPSEVQVTTDRIFRVFFWPSKMATVKEARIGHSLYDCVAQVRTWKEQSQ